MDVGLFGGSFNPPHVGHAMVVSWLLWTEQVEEVWLMPAFEHPFDKQMIPFSERVQACKALADLFPGRVKVTEVESTLPRPSYTFNSLEALATAHPEHRFRLVVGSDILDQVHAWHRWDAILESYSPILLSRAGYRLIPGSPVFPEVSSTVIRERLSAGESVRELVPAAVLDAIGKHYGDNE